MRGSVALPRDLRAVDRRDSQLWSISFVIIVALATGFFIVRMTSQAPGPSWERTVLYGQSVLILLTLAYFVQKRLELTRVRERLLQEKLQRENLRDRYDALGATLEFTTRIGSFGSELEAVQFTAENTLATLQAHHCLIGLHDDSVSGPPPLESHASTASSRDREAVAAAWPDMSAWVLRHDESTLLDPAAPSEDKPVDTELAGIIAVPLRVGGRAIGALMIALDAPDGESRRRFGKYDVRLAEIIANAAAAAFDNARLATRLKHRRDQLRKSLKQLRIAQPGVILGERLKAMEELVDKVAHYISNPLTTISGYAQLLGTQDLDVELKRCLGTIGEEVERCNQAINDLKAFAHRPPSEPRSSDLNKLLKQALFLKAYRFERLSIETRFEPAPSLGAMVLDPVQVQQAFLIVLTDMEKAAERHGHPLGVTVRTEVHGDQARVRFTASSRQIEDGESDAPPPWKPFEEDPDAAEDALVPRDILHAVVRAHGGRNHVEFDPDTRSTTFTIGLPRATSDAAADSGLAPTAANDPGFAPRTPASILVVDDEDRIVNLFRRVLTNEGFTVTAATTGRKAMELLDEQPFDALVLDYHLPDVGAREIADFLTNRRPDLMERLVLISGDDQSASFRTLAGETGAATLAKPFQISEMLEVVSSKVNPRTATPPPQPASRSESSLPLTLP